MTVEGAIVLSALVIVFSVILMGLSAVFDQLRCVDAAREIARLEARGESQLVSRAMAEIGPSGARWGVRHEGDQVEVQVSVTRMGIPLHAAAYSILETPPDVHHVR